jgi:hypothetical protein
VTDAHCNLPLLHGYLPYRPSRGTCEIWSASPNLWFTVAQALGFWVTSLRCQSAKFADIVLPFCPQAAVLAVTPWRCNRSDFLRCSVSAMGRLFILGAMGHPTCVFVSVGDTDRGCTQEFPATKSKKLIKVPRTQQSKKQKV